MFSQCLRGLSRVLRLPPTTQGHALNRLISDSEALSEAAAMFETLNVINHVVYFIRHEH